MAIWPGTRVYASTILVLVKILPTKLATPRFSSTPITVGYFLAKHSRINESDTNWKGLEMPAKAVGYGRAKTVGYDSKVSALSRQPFRQDIIRDLILKS